MSLMVSRTREFIIPLLVSRLASLSIFADCHLRPVSSVKSLCLTSNFVNRFLNANSSKTLTGTSLRTTQYYNVEFWLLAFPLALFALVTIFFFVTVLQTTRVPLWKASQLAVLYTMSRPEELATKQVMENRAEKTRSEFARDSWCLKESQAHVE